VPALPREWLGLRSRATGVARSQNVNKGDLG